MAGHLGRHKRAASAVAIRRACSWAGISDSTLDNWVQAGLVSPPTVDGCELRTVVEMFVFSKLKRTIDFERARSVWYAARTDGADLTSVKKFGRMICGEHAPLGHLALSPREVINAIPDGEPVRVVDVSSWIRTAAAWYDAELKQNWGGAGALDTLHPKRPPSRLTRRSAPQTAGIGVRVP
jgi:hypothetical protein